MDYQLELKQIVDNPRCRIYREFLLSLMKDRDIHTPALIDGSGTAFRADTEP